MFGPCQLSTDEESGPESTERDVLAVGGHRARSVGVDADEQLGGNSRQESHVDSAGHAVCETGVWRS